MHSNRDAPALSPTQLHANTICQRRVGALLCTVLSLTSVKPRQLTAKCRALYRRLSIYLWHRTHVTVRPQSRSNADQRVKQLSNCHLVTLLVPAHCVRVEEACASVTMAETLVMILPLIVLRTLNIATATVMV